MSPTGTGTRPPETPPNRRPPSRRPTAGSSAGSPPNRRPAGGIDPRIRERRTEVTRAAGRRRRRILLGVVVVLLLAVVGLVFLHTKALAARSITVAGSVHTPASTIIATAGLAGHPPMIDVDADAAAARLEQLPWVDTATVSRQWPDGVRIVVTERTPVAVVSTTAAAGQAPAGQGTATVAPAGTEATTTTTAPSTTTTAPSTTTTVPAAEPWALVDRTGRVLADVASPPAGLPHLVAPAAPGAPGTVMPSAGPGLVVAGSLPQAFAGQVAEVDVAADGQVNLKLTSPLTVNLGTTAQLPQKYEDVAAILAGAGLADGDVIDVTVPESPTVTAG